MVVQEAQHIHHYQEIESNRKQASLLFLVAMLPVVAVYGLYQLYYTAMATSAMYSPITPAPDLPSQDENEFTPILSESKQAAKYPEGEVPDDNETCDA